MTRRSVFLGAAGLQRAPNTPDEEFAFSFRDPVALFPALFRTEFDHQCSRTVRVTLPPDHRVRAHDMRAGAIVAVTELHLRFTRMSTRRPYDVHMEPGQIRWFYADTHTLENLSIRKAEYVFVEVKRRTPPRG